MADPAIRNGANESLPILQSADGSPLDLLSLVNGRIVSGQDNLYYPYTTFLRNPLVVRSGEDGTPEDNEWSRSNVCPKPRGRQCSNTSCHRNRRDSGRRASFQDYDGRPLVDYGDENVNFQKNRSRSAPRRSDIDCCPPKRCTSKQKIEKKDRCKSLGRQDSKCDSRRSSRTPSTHYMEFRNFFGALSRNSSRSRKRKGSHHSCASGVGRGSSRLHSTDPPNQDYYLRNPTPAATQCSVRQHARSHLQGSNCQLPQTSQKCPSTPPRRKSFGSHAGANCMVQCGSKKKNVKNPVTISSCNYVADGILPHEEQMTRRSSSRRNKSRSKKKGCSACSSNETMNEKPVFSYRYIFPENTRPPKVKKTSCCKGPYHPQRADFHARRCASGMAPKCCPRCGLMTQPSIRSFSNNKSKTLYKKVHPPACRPKPKMKSTKYNLTICCRPKNRCQGGKSTTPVTGTVRRRSTAVSPLNAVSTSGTASSAASSKMGPVSHFNSVLTSGTASSAAGSKMGPPKRSRSMSKAQPGLRARTPATRATSAAEAKSPVRQPTGILPPQKQVIQPQKQVMPPQKQVMPPQKQVIRSANTSFKMINPAQALPATPRSISSHPSGATASIRRSGPPLRPTPPKPRQKPPLEHPLEPPLEPLNEMPSVSQPKMIPVPVEVPEAVAVANPWDSRSSVQTARNSTRSRRTTSFMGTEVNPFYKGSFLKVRESLENQGSISSPINRRKDIAIKPKKKKFFKLGPSTCELPGKIMSIVFGESFVRMSANPHYSWSWKKMFSFGGSKKKDRNT